MNTLRGAGGISRRASCRKLRGGDVTLRLTTTPVKVHFVRVLMNAASGTAPAGSSDIRDGLGYAIREVYLGRLEQGVLRDVIRHGTKRDRQTLFFVSPPIPGTGPPISIRPSNSPASTRFSPAGSPTTYRFCCQSACFTILPPMVPTCSAMCAAGVIRCVVSKWARNRMASMWLRRITAPCTCKSRTRCARWIREWVGRPILSIPAAESHDGVGRLR